jgi:transcriptional regulator with XRE-family HTH domain
MLRVIDVEAKKLGLEVKERRLRKGLTQRQLASRIGVSPSYISKIEGGVLDPERQGPSELVIRSLAENLAVEGESVDDLSLSFMTECLGKLPRKLQQQIVESIKTGNVPRRSSARSLLKHAGKWVGDDLEQCLEIVYATRSKAEL